MNYKEKYIKYKNKYLKMKNQKGGNLFETLFPGIIEYCINYNRTLTDMGNMFGSNRFVHIKGGASIKYHLSKLGLPIDSFVGITSDIDMYLVSEPDEVENNLTEFLSGLYIKFPGYQWSTVNKNGLVTISVNGTDIIDITIFNEFFEEPDPDTSMFLYAINNLGLKNHKEYFDQLNQIEFELMVKSFELIEQKTFTSLPFERFATIKGIQNQEKYLSSIPNWKRMALYFYDQSQNQSLTEEARKNNYANFERYMYQLSPEYIQKLENKLQRYKQKLEIINKLLGA